MRRTFSCGPKPCGGKVDGEGVEIDVADALKQLGGPEVGEGTARR